MSITPFSFFLFYSFFCFFFLFSLSRILYPIGCRGTLLWHLLTARDRDAISRMGYPSAYRNRHHSIPALASCPCPRWPPRPAAFVPAATAPPGLGSLRPPRPHVRPRQTFRLGVDFVSVISLWKSLMQFMVDFLSFLLFFCLLATFDFLSFFAFLICCGSYGD